MATIVSGTIDTISAGQIDLGDRVLGGGMLDVASDGTAKETVVLGNETVQAGGDDEAALILNGGVQVVLGHAADAVVGSGGSQIVGSGGVASGTTVSGGGVETVAAGGTAANAVIAGGTLDVAAGGALTGSVAFDGGGTLEIDGAAMPAATISGFIDTGQTIDLRGLAFANGGSAVLTGGNVLHISEGGQTVDLQLDPGQNYAGHAFTLADDGQGGTNVVDPAITTDFTVNSESALNIAIHSIDATGSNAATDTAYNIRITGQINLSFPLWAINLLSGSRLTIQGTDGSGGASVQTIDGQGGQRGFFVYSGDVVLGNLAITNAIAQGGAGADIAGGGAGLGGGLFVAAGGNVTLINVSFLTDAAVGGAGGFGPDFGGGGGGLGGAGGVGNGGGGGVGVGADGGTSGAVVGGPGIIPGAAGGGSGLSGGAGGSLGGGGGYGGGGGGVGGHNGGVGGLHDADGGGGGFGGGGGAANFRTGGDGGFGGGGGGGPANGGDGGFGGGGGSSNNANNAGGHAGFGGGDGFRDDFGGGGGLGAGGDIFIQEGGSVLILGGSLGTGTVSGGVGGRAGGFNDGAAYGGGIFLQGNESIQLGAFGGQTLTISGVIADQGGNGGSGSLVVGGGDGTIVLDAANTYTGGTTLDGGTLELAALGAAGSGGITFGDGITGTLQVDNAALSSNALGNVIAGFTLGNTIDLTGLNFVSGSTSATLSGSTLTVTNGGTSDTFTLSGVTAGALFNVGQDAGTGTDVTAACFCCGTLILTDKGEVAVEDLAIGDMVVTVSDDTKPIKWIGRRAYDGRFVAGNCQVLPIRIAADALADGVPARDLWLSPEHSLYLDGVLVQAKDIVNGATVVQAESVERVEYFHIELDSHDVIYADGAPAETFVDCDNRLMFANGAEYFRLYPDDDRPGWEFCVPRLDWGSAELSEIRAALLWRAEALGHALDRDPDLHLVMEDGAIVRPERLAEGHYRFAVPIGCTALWVASRSTVPAEVAAEASDMRRLGVAVERLILYDADLFIEAWHGHAALCDGFHDAEAAHRWTNGLARLPESLLRPFAGSFTLELQIAASDLAYRLPADLRDAAAA